MPGGGSALQDLSVRSVVEPSVETVRKRMEWLVASPERMTDEMVEIRLRLYSFPENFKSMQNVYYIGREWKRIRSGRKRTSRWPRPSEEWT